MQQFILTVARISIFFFLPSNGYRLEPVINTVTGIVRGSSMVSTAGRQFSAFRGIPYAQPPVGQLRFKDPDPIKPWDGVFDATREGPICVQKHFFLRHIRGSEDCLVLNIYAHNDDFLREIHLRPVLVFIHGGGWFMGSGNGESDLYGPHNFMDYDLVLVTINYRLGPLGFFSTEDKESPGNYGLLDQTMALKWIRDNVHYFGGNPQAVTIFGENAGGASVHYHILSPLSKGLFHRAIIQSGSSLCPWAIVEKVKKSSVKLGAKLNCPATPSRDLVECMKTKTVHEIMSSFANLSEHLFMPMLLFGPRVDTERRSPFLPDKPQGLISKGQISHVPLIIGVNKNEGAIFTASLLNSQGEIIKDLLSDPVKSMTYLLMNHNRDDGSNLTQRALDHYLNSSDITYLQLSHLEQMLSDFMFFKCVDDAAVLHSSISHKSVYYYYYAHRGRNTFSTLFGIPPSIDLGVCHGDELLLMFSNQLFPSSESSEGLRVAKTLTDLWASFTINGTPSSSNLFTGWLPLNSGKARYLKIDTQPTLIEEMLPYYGRLQFWNDINGVSPRIPSFVFAILLLFVTWILF